MDFSTRGRVRPFPWFGTSPFGAVDLGKRCGRALIPGSFAPGSMAAVVVPSPALDATGTEAA